MTDQDLAEKLVALVVIFEGESGVYWMDEWSCPLNCHDVARNSCAAMELMTRCDDLAFCKLGDGRFRVWGEDGVDVTDDSLPRAIITACVKALEEAT